MISWNKPLVSGTSLISGINFWFKKKILTLEGRKERKKMGQLGSLKTRSKHCISPAVKAAGLDGAVPNLS